MRNAAPVTVQIPPEGSDRPSWVKVGVIAVVGFAVGIAWPRLAGIRPGPSAPGESQAAATSAPAGHASDATEQPAAAAVASAAPASSAASAASGDAPVPMNNAPPAVLVTRGAVMTCKTADGEVLHGADKCGAVTAFDGLAQPRLKKLAYCPQAHGASGKLGVLFSLDFVRNKINFGFGKSSTVDNRDSLDQCLRMSFENVSLGPVTHDNPTYAVYYSVTFTPRDSTSMPPAATQAAEESSGPQTAQVAWEVAIVRDAPRTGSVVGRLQRGTKVRVGSGGQDGWYRVKYGSDFGSEGWVYRGAIGK
jgi:hypothetical protein